MEIWALILAECISADNNYDEKSIKSNIEKLKKLRDIKECPQNYKDKIPECLEILERDLEEIEY